MLIDEVIELEANIVETGPQGLSAYEIYQKNGGMLSETEWLESLKGKDGKDGENGQDGKDYILTEEDKQEIANIVLSELPNSEEVNY